MMLVLDGISSGYGGAMVLREFSLTVRKGEVVKRLVDEGKPPGAVIEELYVRCLARSPTPLEMERLSAEVASIDNQRNALEDVFWALLNSKEFVFNH